MLRSEAEKHYINLKLPSCSGLQEHNPNVNVCLTHNFISAAPVIVILKRSVGVRIKNCFSLIVKLKILFEFFEVREVRKIMINH